MSAGLLVTGGALYTVDPDDRAWVDGAVLIEDGAIVDVGSRPEVERRAGACARSARHVDAGGGVILPGLVNTHWHDFFAFAPLSAPSASASMLPSSPPEASMFARGGSILEMSQRFDLNIDLMSRIRPEDARAISRYAVWTQLRSGTTTLAEVGSFNSPRALADSAAAHGVRAVVSPWTGDGVCGSDGFRRTRPTDAVLAGIRSVLDEVSARHDDRIRAMPSLIYITNASDELLRGLALLADLYDTPVAMHVGAQANERAVHAAAFGSSAVERLDRAGLLSPRLIAVHCAHVTDAEQRLLADRGVRVDHSPASYGTQGESVISRRGVIELAHHGVGVSLSTDAELTPGGGMIPAMRQAWLGHNEVWSDETTVPPEYALRMATRNAAEALGWGKQIGSLELGKRADLTIVRMPQWQRLLAPSPLLAVLRSASAADVDTVLVDGEVRLSAGRVPGLDEAAMRTEYLASAASALRDVFGSDTG